MSIEEKVYEYGVQHGVFADYCEKIGEIDNLQYYLYCRKRENEEMLPPLGLPVVAKVEGDKIELLEGLESLEMMGLFDMEE